MNSEYSDHTLRDMYDPSDAYAGVSDSSFFAEVAAHRNEIHLPGFGEITPYESMLLESRHMLISTPRSVLEGVTDDRAHSLARFETARTQTMVNHIAYVAYDRKINEEQRRRTHNLEQSAVDTIDGEIDVMLFAARVLAHIAHNGVMRRNGRPYITHPESVASIVDVGWNRGARPHTQPRDTLRTFKSIAYLHDTFEDTITRDGSYLAHDIVASPLVIRGLLARYDFSHPKTVARAVRLLTHNSGALPGTTKVGYGDYLRRGAALGGQNFLVPKGADVQHNSGIDIDTSLAYNETQEQKLSRRVARYESGKHTLLSSADEFSDQDGRWALHTIFQVTGPQMERVYGQLVDIRLNDDELHPPSSK